MDLKHPVDLEAWSRWHRAQRPVATRLRDRLRRDAPVPTFTLVTPAEPSRVVVGVEARTPSVDAAVLDLARALGNRPLLLAPSGVDVPAVDGELAVHGLTAAEVAARLPAHPICVTTGHYLPGGALLHEVAERRGAPFVVVQHGVLTPFAPPLPRRCTLLAWTDADARLWCGSEPDRHAEVVGSALLAARGSSDRPARGAPVFLGQLHGIELGTVEQLRVAGGFCRSTGATYRPHPSEVDRTSSAAHRLLRAAGVTLGRSDVPLRDLDAPVVSIFSTGVLEAAASGGRAWVHHPRPAPWLTDLWDRYGMRPWGGEPTAPLPAPTADPAAAAAAVVHRLVAA